MWCIGGGGRKNSIIVVVGANNINIIIMTTGVGRTSCDPRPRSIGSGRD